MNVLIIQTWRQFLQFSNIKQVTHVISKTDMIELYLNFLNAGYAHIQYPSSYELHLYCCKNILLTTNRVFMAREGNRQRLLMLEGRNE